MRECFVSIMTNASHTHYTGVTGNLERRVFEHRNKLIVLFNAFCRDSWLFRSFGDDGQPWEGPRADDLYPSWSATGFHLD